MTLTQRAVAKRTLSIRKVVVEEHGFNTGAVRKRVVSIRRTAVEEHGFNTEGGGREDCFNTYGGGGGEDGSNTKEGGGEDGFIQNSFLADLTDSVSNPDLLTSEISYTIVLNAHDQLKKGKSDGSSPFSYFLYCQRYSQQPFESTFHCCCKTWLCSQALKRWYFSANSQARERPDLPGNYRPVALDQTLSKVFTFYSSMETLYPPCLFKISSPIVLVKCKHCGESLSKLYQKKKEWLSFSMLNSTELLTRGDN